MKAISRSKFLSENQSVLLFWCPISSILTTMRRLQCILTRHSYNFGCSVKYFQQFFELYIILTNKVREIQDKHQVHIVSSSSSSHGISSQLRKTEQYKKV